MSWFEETKLGWLERLAVNVVGTGPIPKHVAFIMDGNRRYANKQQVDKIQGHIKGFEKLTRTLEWCSNLGINEVTVYAFSIENFKRPKDEVDGLLELAEEKFRRLLEERDKLMEREICIRMFGDLSLLPKSLQNLLEEVVLITRHNKKAFLNVCFAYTSRHEIAMAVEAIASGVHSEILKPSDVTESLLNKCLYTSSSPDPDLLVRTSGEVRLSDFLLWQSSFAVLAFADVLWPDFSIWDLLKAVFFYQRHHHTTSKSRENYKHQLMEKEENQLKSLYQNASEISSDHSFDCYQKEANQRVESFLKQREAISIC